MLQERNPENYNLPFEIETPGSPDNVESEKDCPLCSQPEGTNPDCRNCRSKANWTPEQLKNLLDQKRKSDQKFGYGKKSKKK